MSNRYFLMNKNRIVGIMQLSPDNVFITNAFIGNIPYDFSDIEK